MTSRFKALVSGLMLLLLMMPALASAKPTPPDELAKNAVQNILDAMEGQRDELRSHPQKLYSLIDKQLVPLVDLPYMSQLVLGRPWRSATPEQRKRFETAFKNMLVRTYGNGLLGFHDQDRIEYLPLRAPDDAKDVTFRAKIKTDGGDTVPVSLQMHLVDGHWKVYNGSVGNLSFVTNYRGQFRSQLRHGDLEDLIERMEKRYNPDQGGS